MISPSRLTLTPHQGALTSTSTYTGEQTLDGTDAQYWRASLSWDNLDDPEEHGRVICKEAEAGQYGPIE